MNVFHEIEQSSLDAALTDGLKRVSRGEKGDDSTIAKTDKILDKYCPDSLKDRQVSRDDNLYAFVADGDNVVDIQTGNIVELENYLEKSDQVLLKLWVRPDACFVSDLDRYDEIKKMVEKDDKDSNIKKMCEHYWASLMPLFEFSVGSIQRPEVMITYDVAPDMIEVV